MARNKVVNGVVIPLTAEEEADIDVAQAAAKTPEALQNVELEKVLDARRKEYGPIGDQLDMQYWDQVNSTTTWVDRVADVKSKHPKP
jgi:succinyl-CoA synthetase beta subunit